MKQKLIKSKKRVREFAEVFTPDFIVKDMCDLIPAEMWENIESTFLEPSCVDSETEFFNGYKWIKISEYNNEKVLCYNTKNMRAELLKPIRYIKQKTEEKMVLWASPKLNMCLSCDHKVLFYNYKNKLKWDTAQNVYKNYYANSNGFRGKIPNTFNYGGKLNLNEWELRLAIACNADGRLLGKFKKSYQIRVKKQRKSDRLKMLLQKCGITYKYKIYDGYHDYTFISPLGCKFFPEEWVNLTPKLKSVFIEEIAFWDGCITKEGATQYCSNKKKDIDIVQFIAHSIGYRTNVFNDVRYKNTNYRLTIYKGSDLALDRRHKNYFSLIDPPDGYKYCFTVKTGALILRRQNKIFITGNCGNGNFLVEILARKYTFCQNEKDGLKALASVVGVDIQADNCHECRTRLLKQFMGQFPQASELTILLASGILANNIICGDFLDPNEKLKALGAVPDENYIKAKNKLKEKQKNASK